MVQRGYGCLVKMVAVHTCPLWEDANGERLPSVAGEPNLPFHCVGWVNAARIIIDGDERWFLLTLDA